MKHTLLVTALFLCLTASLSAWSWFGFKVDPKDRALYKLIGKLQKELTTEFGLSGCAAGGSTMDGIKNITLYFNHYGALELDEIKRLVVLCAERMIQRMNEDEGVRPYLVKYPVTVDNITIGIGNYDKNGREVYPPYPSSMAVSAGKIRISYADRTAKYEIGERFSEPYEPNRDRVLGLLQTDSE